jgi:hypothetical protein
MIKTRIGDPFAYHVFAKLITCGTRVKPFVSTAMSELIGGYNAEKILDKVNIIREDTRLALWDLTSIDQGHYG